MKQNKQPTFVPGVRNEDIRCSLLTERLLSKYFC